MSGILWQNEVEKNVISVFPIMYGTTLSCHYDPCLRLNGAGSISLTHTVMQSCVEIYYMHWENEQIFYDAVKKLWTLPIQSLSPNYVSILGCWLFRPCVFQNEERISKENWFVIESVLQYWSTHNMWSTKKQSWLVHRQAVHTQKGL